MKEAGVKYFAGAHCTGINSTYEIRKFMGLLSKNSLVGSVGTYINKDGIVPGYMEQLNQIHIPLINFRGFFDFIDQHFTSFYRGFRSN